LYYGLWLGNTSRGEWGFAREIAETFLHEAGRGARTTEYGFGRQQKVTGTGNSALSKLHHFEITPTAITVAQQQKARSFELRAALSLVKLHHSTDRPADAHAVLASALKGFSPTPEFPEIAEAQTLLTALTS
jgi:hypothetical protein